MSWRLFDKENVHGIRWERTPNGIEDARTVAVYPIGLNGAYVMNVMNLSESVHHKRFKNKSSAKNYAKTLDESASEWIIF